ncbi:MAG: helix-turn-helix domain-containing protein [Fimbriiglobus sp.]|jgi:transcriptional regulator with XRE-family HTH domain|nr:helix-turn-helix domain-containing protein [Fimbriiglobus sp.]
MSVPAASDERGNDDLARKIAKLVEERGWNQEVFAKACRLNRHTVRQILHAGPQRRLRNATVRSCAEALGLTVNELRTLPLERLLPRMHGKPPADEEARKQLRSSATLPEFVAWLERNPDRADDFRADEITELLSMQEAGGAMERLGVEQCVENVERKRELLLQVKMIMSTEYIGLLEQVVDLVMHKINAGRQQQSPTPGRGPRVG